MSDRLSPDYPDDTLWDRCADELDESQDGRRQYPYDVRQKLVIRYRQHAARARDPLLQSLWKAKFSPNLVQKEG
jgi:hypothetical protein